MVQADCRMIFQTAFEPIAHGFQSVRVSDVEFAVAAFDNDALNLTLGVMDVSPIDMQPLGNTTPWAPVICNEIPTPWSSNLIPLLLIYFEVD